MTAQSTRRRPQRRAWNRTPEARAAQSLGLRLTGRYPLRRVIDRLFSRAVADDPMLPAIVGDLLECGHVHLPGCDRAYAYAERRRCAACHYGDDDMLA